MAYGVGREALRVDQAEEMTVVWRQGVCDANNNASRVHPRADVTMLLYVTVCVRHTDAPPLEDALKSSPANTRCFPPILTTATSRTRSPTCVEQ